MNSQEHNGRQGPEDRVVGIISSNNSASDGAEEERRRKRSE